MKPPAAEVARKGPVVRVAGGPDEGGADPIALAFLDLRFADGHLERWLGPGSVGELAEGPEALVALQEWVRASVGDFAADIMGDVARTYTVEDPSIVDDLPFDDVVIEWNSSLARGNGPPFRQTFACGMQATRLVGGSFDAVASTSGYAASVTERCHVGLLDDADCAPRVVRR